MLLGFTKQILSGSIIHVNLSSCIIRQITATIKIATLPPVFSWGGHFMSTRSCFSSAF